MRRGGSSHVSRSRAVVTCAVTCGPTGSACYAAGTGSVWSAACQVRHRQPAPRPAANRLLVIDRRPSVPREPSIRGHHRSVGHQDTLDGDVSSRERHPRQSPTADFIDRGACKHLALGPRRQLHRAGLPAGRRLPPRHRAPGTRTSGPGRSTRASRSATEGGSRRACSSATKPPPSDLDLNSWPRPHGATARMTAGAPSAESEFLRWSSAQPSR